MAKACEECRKLKRQFKDLEAEFRFLREDSAIWKKGSMAVQVSTPASEISGMR